MSEKIQLIRYDWRDGRITYDVKMFYGDDAHGTSVTDDCGFDCATDAERCMDRVRMNHGIPINKMVVLKEIVLKP